MKKSNIVLIFIIVLLGVAVIYLVARGGEKPAAEVAETPKGESANMPAADDFMKPHVAPALTAEQKAELAAGQAAHAPTTLTYHITGGSFYYAPNEIVAKAGDTVKIIFDDVGGMHNVTFDNPKIATKTIKTGEKDTIEFKAPKQGTYEFYCSVGKGYHRMMGQIGVLLVQ